MLEWLIINGTKQKSASRLQYCAFDILIHVKHNTIKEMKYIKVL